MKQLQTMSHWQCEYDEQGVIWLTLSCQNSNINTLNTEVLREFKAVLHTISSGARPKGLVIQAGKKNGFIAGADIQQFQTLETADSAFELIREGQLILQKLEELPIPTVALIHGFCLGGGLELALACQYRITDDAPETTLGLPEVSLGLHPGWGGTIRLPRLIGALKAMDLILSGRTVSGLIAKKMSFVDLAVPRRHFQTAARYLIDTRPPVKKAKGFDWMTNWDIIRPLLAKIIQRKLVQRVNRMHYPAPFAVVDNFVAHGISEVGYVSEARSLAQLIVSESAQNLVRVFYLKEKLKSLSRDIYFKPAHVHVVGAGIMGGDIAGWCALKGIKVTLHDSNVQAIAESLKRALVLFKKRLKEPHLIQAAKDRLLPDREGKGISSADIIIEAIIEKKEAKQALFANIEQQAKREAIFATNTSTFLIEELSQSLKNPERLVGVHFFNPVSKMPLVEIVVGEQSQIESVEQGMAFIRSIDKLPLPVKSSPGFLVNRLLTPYLIESMRLLEEGIPAQVIDKVAEDFGMPIGPIELADTVGLDVCLYAFSRLNQPLGEQIPVRIRRLVEQGLLGKKTGHGFYLYKNNKPVKDPIEPSYRAPADILDRLLLCMLNEAMACVRKNIIADADLLDAGMIFGAGFAPFRGGPLHYVMEQGKGLLLQRLKLLAERYGDRFLPDEGWNIVDAT
jgi:3-hydroxyacyl-CoA dehydrogenase/enoyl-CoA hydratase/3-hydroxybutyryl-CoA epimerase